jgi:hypothetical protein
VNRKFLLPLLLIAFLIVGISTVIIISQKQKSVPQITHNYQLPQPTIPTKDQGIPILSPDKKNIVLDGKAILSVDNDIIFNWFKTKTGMCSEDNIIHPNTMEISCENKTTFRKYVNFASIIVSSDKSKIGFTIEAIPPTSDYVVGLFSRSADKVDLLTDYYLGNDFISFSPSGRYFVYKCRCFEGICGLYIKNSENLTTVASLNNPQYDDMRQYDTNFVRWISDNQVEYKVNTQLKTESF